jgi:osmotically-inducible protein OsmY
MKNAPVLGAATLAALLLLSLPARAEVAVTDLTPQLQAATLGIHDLRAVEVGGIVVLRGKTTDRAEAERAGIAAQSLGYSRVANLIQVVTPPDDQAIERIAERKLAIRGLDGCTFRVDSDHGILSVAGRVQYELQKDVAVGVLRNIDGVREVKTDWQK